MAEYKDEIRFLGFELGKVLREQGEQELYERVETIRQLAKKRRNSALAAERDEAEQQLRGSIAALSEAQLAETARAMALFFDLANLAEDRHRVKLLRAREDERFPHPREGSFGEALEELASAGMSAQELRAHLQKLRVEPVFTAHPTEAKRRTVRAALARLRADLAVLDSSESLKREKELSMTRLRAELSVLWHTETLHEGKPQVLDEARWNLFLAEALWEAVPRLYRQARRVLGRVYPGEDFRALGSFLRFGSWIGGDRDGNPFVTADVTRQVLDMARTEALRLHLKDAARMTEALAVSTRRIPLPPELQSAIDLFRRQDRLLDERLSTVHPAEGYRCFLELVRRRLELAQSLQPGGYQRPTELLLDLQALHAALLQARYHDLAQAHLQAWIDRTVVFGFQIWKLDLREDSRVLVETIESLVSGYAQMQEDDRCAYLRRAVPRKLAEIDPRGLPPNAQRTMELFDLLARLEEDGQVRELVQSFIVAMTHEASDVLSIRWLWELARIRRGTACQGLPVPVAMAPLLETIDDLQRGRELVSALLDDVHFAATTQAMGGEMMVMIGYSDSCKDGGALMSAWSLYQAQEALSELARKRAVRLVFFHGRGGSLGRGGGHASRTTLSLPPGSVNGALRVTEQGEVLAERYDDPEIAVRHLEQLLHGTLLATARPAKPVPQRYRSALELAAGHGLARYRSLRNDSAFMDYFGQATPVEVIERMPIGSRPARRRARKSLEDLRAIPYTFAWTQTRQLLTALDGIGSGLAAVGDAELLCQMNREWPFFANLVENVQLALFKADEGISRWYADLPRDRDCAQRLASRIAMEIREVRRQVEIICAGATLEQQLPWLAAGVRARNPYVDALNAIQVELLRRGSESGSQALRLTVQGIAAGLRTTG